MSEKLGEQLKLAHMVFDVVDRAKRKICVTPLRNDEKKPETSYAQVQIICKEERGREVRTNFFVMNKFEEIIYLLHVINSVYDKDITNKLICNFLFKATATICFLSFFYSSHDELENWR